MDEHRHQGRIGRPILPQQRRREVHLGHDPGEAQRELAQRQLAMAQERGFDLVEVAPTAAPPVCKFLDFGQYKYELAKREKDLEKAGDAQRAELAAHVVGQDFHCGGGEP